MVQLRPVLVDDVKYFATWWRDDSLIVLTSGNHAELSNNQLEKYFREILEQRNRIDCMIEVGGETVGHVNAQERTEDWYELQIVIGNKEYWGKGYGPAAILLFLQRLSARGIQKVYLEVRPENVRAIHAYEKCGFREVRREYYAGTNQPETIRMELTV
jgi:RimJ/RimL family protein N-acetyltransferase